MAFLTFTFENPISNKCLADSESIPFTTFSFLGLAPKKINCQHNLYAVIMLFQSNILSMRFNLLQFYSEYKFSVAVSIWLLHKLLEIYLFLVNHTESTKML